MNRPLWKYLASLVLLGSNGVVAAQISLGSTDIVLLRALFGLLGLLCVWGMVCRRWTFYRYRRELVYVVLTGAATAVNWLTLFAAYQMMGVSLGIIFNYCGPAVVIVLAPVMLHDRFTAVKGITLCCVILGVCCISGQAAGVNLTAAGMVYGALAAVSFAFMILFNKKVDHVPGLERVILQMVVSVLIIGSIAWYDHGWYMPIQSSDWLPAIWLGVMNTGLAYYLYFSCMSGLSVQTISICGYLEPVSSVFLSMLILHEVMMPVQWVGAVLIIGSAVWSEYRQSSHPVSAS